jgi:EamA domain-containing membrane protein RarD
VIIVILAFASYSTAIITQLRRRAPTPRMRAFLTAGVLLDATSTSFMIAGSRRIPLTFHGVLGYSAFLLMLIDLILVWRFYRRQGPAELPRPLHRYSIAAFSWWTLAFIAGPIVAFRL